jgi:hypothetical protein
MKPEERAYLDRLVHLIKDEKDINRFTDLVTELIALLQKKERRLREGD